MSSNPRPHPYSAHQPGWHYLTWKSDRTCPLLAWRVSGFSLPREWILDPSSDIWASLSVSPEWRHQLHQPLQTASDSDTLAFSARLSLLQNGAHTTPSLCLPAPVSQWHVTTSYCFERTVSRDCHSGFQSWLCHLRALDLEEVILPLGAFVSSFVNQGKISAHLTRLLSTLSKQIHITNLSCGYTVNYYD